MADFFSTYSFRALWTPELIVVLLFTALIYYGITFKKRSTLEEADKVPVRRNIYFVLGLAALYFGWGSPLYVAGHSIITLHMTQMVFAYFAAVPLFILALPKPLVQSVMDTWQRKAEWTYRIIMNPIIGLITFNALFSFYHIPVVFDEVMQAPVLHSLYQGALFASAWLMWWHMLSPLPSGYKLPDLRRIVYIFANGILITPACAMIIFAGSPLYETYTNPAVWSEVMAYCLPPGTSPPTSMMNDGTGTMSFLDAHSDQQLAGVVMKISQELVYVTTIGYVFKQWLAKEQPKEGEWTISDIPTDADRLK